MNRVTVLLYGAACYVIFLLTFLYAIGFVANAVVPKGIDAGIETPPGQAVVINVLLLAVFAVQHSVMARPWFKERWNRVVPQHVERSTYVLLASLALILLFWQWRPLRGVVWDVDFAAARIFLWGLSAAGWLMVLISTCLIDHFDLFGLRQVYFYFRGQPYRPPEFKKLLFYKYIRHPLMLGFLIAFWSTPQMSAGHLLFALVTTAYILVAIQLEERDLASAHGEEYERYRRQVSMLIPLPGKRSS